MMNRIVVELWLWLNHELKEDFESISEMRSRKEEMVEEGMTVQQLLEKMAKRYPILAQKVFNLNEKRVFPYVVVNFNDRVISPYEVYDRVLKDGDKITILPMYMGG